MWQPLGLHFFVQRPLTSCTLSDLCLVFAYSVLRNKLGDGADILVAAARELPQLTTLCGIQPTQKDIDLSQQCLDDGDAKLLAFDLSKNQAIERLK